MIACNIVAEAFAVGLIACAVNTSVPPEWFVEMLADFMGFFWGTSHLAVECHLGDDQTQPQAQGRGFPAGQSGPADILVSLRVYLPGAVS